MNLNKEIISLYSSGIKVSEIVLKCSVSRTTIYRILKDSHITREQGESLRMSSGHTINHFAFHELTDESAYWIGFLMADGNITKNSVRLGLMPSDIEHLQKFRTFVHGTQKFIKNQRSLMFQIHSKIMVSKLQDYNIIPNKTFKATTPPILQNNRHYWRGIIDGDGCISLVNNKILLSLTGTYSICQQFSDYIYDNCFPIRNTITPRHNALNITSSIKNTFEIRYRGNTARNIIKNLYSNNNIVLDRKWQLAKEVIYGLK